MMKLVSHRDETSVSSWWNLCLITMRLTLYACIKNAQHAWERNGEQVIKNAGTGGKRFANRWGKLGETIYTLSNQTYIKIRTTIIDSYYKGYLIYQVTLKTA